MTAPAYFTWDYDVDTARVATAASLDDLGSAVLEDHAKTPPKPPTQPYAAQLNQWAKQLGGVNRVVESLTIEVTITAGAPAIASVKAMGTIPTTTWAQANMTVTDNGTGDTTITWPVGSVPSPRGKPEAWVTEDVACLQAVAIAAGAGVRVKTRNSSGVLTDYNFAVRVF